MSARRASLPARPLLQAQQLFVGRRNLGSPLVYWEGKGPELARALPADEAGLAPLADLVVRQVTEAWTVKDGDGPLFGLRRYEAADDLSFDVVDPDGEPLATFWSTLGCSTTRWSCATARPHRSVRSSPTTGSTSSVSCTGSLLAESRRVLERPGGEPTKQIWQVVIHRDGDELSDRRVLVAAPLVCLLTGHAKREWDPDSTLGAALLVAFPPAGLLVLAVERTLDGLYWLRRKLN